MSGESNSGLLRRIYYGVLEWDNKRNPGPKINIWVYIVLVTLLSISAGVIYLAAV